MSDDDYFYCLVRKDIPVQDQVCQVAHACVEAGKRYMHPEHTNLVLLELPNKKALLEMAAKLDRNRVDYFLNSETDDNMGETSICTAVVRGSTRRLFSSIPLWKIEPELVAA